MEPTNGLLAVFDDWKLSRQLLKISATKAEEEQADMYLIGGIVRTIIGEVMLDTAGALSGRIDARSLTSRHSYSAIERLALSTFLVSGFAPAEGVVEEAYTGTTNKREKLLPGWNFAKGKIKFSATERKMLVGRASLLFGVVGNAPNNPQREAKNTIFVELGENIQPYADTLSQLYNYWRLN